MIDKFRETPWHKNYPLTAETKTQHDPGGRGQAWAAPCWQSSLIPVSVSQEGTILHSTLPDDIQWRQLGETRACLEVRRTAAGNSFPFVQLYGGFYGIFKHLGCCVRWRCRRGAPAPACRGWAGQCRCLHSWVAGLTAAPPATLSTTWTQISHQPFKPFSRGVTAVGRIFKKYECS